MKMTKRFGNFHTDLNHKKSKVDNLDHLWDDDLDVNDIDDCFALATQLDKGDATSTQRNNISLLPSYTSFKKIETNAFTSTQRDHNTNKITPFPSSTNTTNKPFISAQSDSNLQERMAPSTSNGPVKALMKRTQSFDSVNTPAHLEMQIKKLKEEYEVKVGEVGILRSQLKQIKENGDHEHSRKEKEWLAKYATIQKEMNVVKSELQFKNLEIANLKQRVVDVSKITKNANTSLTVSNKNTFQSVHIEATEPILHPKKSHWKINVVLPPKYPLKGLSSDILDSIPREKYIEQINSSFLSSNVTPFLKYQMLQDETNRIIRLQPKCTLVADKQILTFEFVRTEVLQLINSNVTEYKEKINVLNKIIIVSYQLISDVNSFLRVLKDDVTSENIRQADLQFLKTKRDILEDNINIFSPKKWIENEMGISARLSIAFLSELIHWSSYVRSFVIENKCLKLSGSEEYLHYLPNSSMLCQVPYLKVIYEVMDLIGKLRLSQNFSGLFCSVLALLDGIFSFPMSNETQDLLNGIVREIILARPDIKVLQQFTIILRHPMIINLLCISKAKLEQIRGIFYYNQDSCILYVFIALLDAYKDYSMSLMQKVYVNLITFMSNVIKGNPKWFHYEEKAHCDCLGKLVKLFIDIFYKMLKRYLNNNNGIESHLIELFRNGLKVLNELNSSMCDMIVKYVNTYSQYKFIAYSLIMNRQRFQLDDFDVEVLEDCNISEEIPVIDESQFDKLSISMWK